MARYIYIDAEKIKKAIKDYCKGCISDGIKTLDVQEVRHGKWIDEQLDKFRKCKSTCSVCGWNGVSNYDSYVDIYDFEYCPNCGAKMDKE